MRNRMSYLLIALATLLCTVTAADAQVSVQVGLPGINIGINVPRYPRLVLVPDSPVYYAPQEDSNYFFYDGLYWVYADDNWYASSWYNGPWDLVDPYDVPMFVLRVPVRYYRQPPVYFRAWRSDASPRWNEHWGRDWHARRGGWDQRNPKYIPSPAPPPVYQRNYSGSRYPGATRQQDSIRSRNYRHQPREAVTRQHYAAPPDQGRQYKNRQNQPVPQNRDQQNNPAPQDRGQQKKNAKHGQGKG